MFDMTTTARMRLGRASTERGIVATEVRPKPRELDASAVTSGCPFCDDDGCSDCQSQPPPLPPMRVRSLGTTSPRTMKPRAATVGSVPAPFDDDGEGQSDTEITSDLQSAAWADLERSRR